MKRADQISQWLAKRVREAGAKGIVVGMSGGVDSSTVAVLAQRALGEAALGLIMPCHSDPTTIQDARLVADKFGIRTEEVNLTPVFDALVGLLPPGGQIAVGNLKPRLRMTTLYYFANRLNYLVAGTGNKSEIMVGYFCYDERTRAMTTEGLKTYQELKPGDLVFSLDLHMGHVVERPVAEVHVFDYEGEMLAYGGGPGSRIDLLVTPNHRLLIERGGRLEFCRADALPRRPTPTPSPRPWTGTRVPSPVFEFDHDGIGPNARHLAPMPMDEFLYVLGLYIGDGQAQISPVVTSLHNGLGSKTLGEANTSGASWSVQPVKGSGNPPRDPETGRFVAVDSPAVPKEYTGYRTWFALPEGSEARSKLIAILEKNGIVYGTTDMQVWVCGKPFYHAMESCGTSAHTKRIPGWVMLYPAEYLARLLEGLMDSDGDGRNYYYTASQRLAEQIVELGCKLGKNVALRTRLPRTSVRANGVETRSSVCYEVSVYGNGRHWLHGAKFKRVPYRGVVWCPDVPDAHNLLIERNGRFLFCGNTKYGDGGVDLLPLGGLYKTQVRELARELGIPEEIIAKPPSAGLWEGQTDEGELGITYEELDRTLAAIESGDTTGVGPEILARVQSMIAASAHKRAPIPVCEVSTDA